MISTVTGAEYIPHTTAATMSSFGVIATAALMALLVIKELATTSENPRLQLLGRHPYVVVVPLLFVFCLIIVADLL